jgi:hypothetical protein
MRNATIAALGLECAELAAIIVRNSASSRPPRSGDVLGMSAAESGTLLDEFGDRD